MTRSIIWVLVLVFTSIFHESSYAQENIFSKITSKKSNSQLKKLPENIQLEKSLLWEITGNGLKRPSYLFGTIHAICEEDFFWSSSFEKAFNQSDEIIFEVDYEAVIEYFSHVLDQDILNKYYYKDNPQLQAEEIKSDRNEVGKRSSDFQNPFRHIQKKKSSEFKNPFKNRMNRDNPFENIKNKAEVLKSSLFLYALEGVQSFDDCGNIISYEVKLLEKGLVAEKSFDYMETIEEQMDALMSTNDIYRTEADNDNANMDTTSYESKVQELVRLYKSQDIMALYSFMVKPELGIVDLEAVLFVRNKLWIDRLADKFKSGKSFFIAVGAGHLASEEGLIHLLRNEGYIVRPIF